jgi:hypothetical protein
MELACHIITSPVALKDLNSKTTPWRPHTDGAVLDGLISTIMFNITMGANGQRNKGKSTFKVSVLV